MRRDCDNVDDLLAKLTAEMWNATRTSCDFDSFVSIKLIGSVNSIVMRSNDMATLKHRTTAIETHKHMYLKTLHCLVLTDY